MIKETIKMKYVTCPCCGNPLFRVTGNCSVDIPCPRCQKTIICDVDGIYVSVFERNENDNEPKFGIQTQYQAPADLKIRSVLALESQV